MGFWVVQVALGQVSQQVLWFPPVSIIPSSVTNVTYLAASWSNYRIASFNMDLHKTDVINWVWISLFDSKQCFKCIREPRNRPRRSYKRNSVEGRVLDWCGSGYANVAGCCVHGSSSCCSINRGIYGYWMVCSPFERVCAPCLVGCQVCGRFKCSEVTLWW
jgi:hypothetical protein